MRYAMPRRAGVSLLEVLASTALFLLSLVAIRELMNSATDLAIEVQQRSRATRLCQSKMNEFVAGIESVTAGSSGVFEEDDQWEWTADVQSDSNAPNLYVVTVTVTREMKNGPVTVSMSQMIFDPQQRGQVMAGTAMSTTTSTTTDSSMTGSTGTTGGTTGGGTTGGGTTGGGATSGNLGGGATGGGRTGGTTGGGGNTGGGRTGGGR